jgi:hypothetical protein
MRATKSWGEFFVVIAGLDPAIHLLEFLDGCAGQARA